MGSLQVCTYCWWLAHCAERCGRRWWWFFQVCPT